MYTDGMTTCENITPASYYRLCRDADRLGVPTSLDDPRSPTTVRGLLDAVIMQRQLGWYSGRNMGAFPLREEIAAEYGVAI